MKTTDLPPLIRDCVDGGTSPVTFWEIKERAVTRERPVRRLPVRRHPVLTATATGLAAAGIAGALVVSHSGGTTDRAVLTAATIKQMVTASTAAMTSGRADIYWTSAGQASLTQLIEFDGANFRDVSQTSGTLGKVPISPSPVVGTWTGETINEAVDGQAYHYPAMVFKPKPHIAAGWMRIDVKGAGQPLEIPDPRALLSVLSPSAAFVIDGYSTVDGTRVRHLLATTPGQVPLAPLHNIIQSEPDSPRLSALDLWVNSAGVVLKARMVVTGTSGGDVTVTVTFSQVGQPQSITAPEHFTTFGH